MKKLLLLLLLLGWCQTGLTQILPCNFSNTGASSGTASINAAPGFSAVNGVGAVGFRLPVQCSAHYVAYFVLTIDSTMNSDPNRNKYDIGLYCQSGDCANNGNGGRLYVHTGMIAGRNFTNNRLAVNPSGVTVEAVAGSPVMFKGAFPNTDDWPPGIEFTVTPASCTGAGSTFNVKTWSPAQIVTAQNATADLHNISCTLSARIPYPPGFTGTTICNNSNALSCMMVLPWIADGQTVCTAIPCNLPAGIYAAAIGKLQRYGRHEVRQAQRRRRYGADLSVYCNGIIGRGPAPNQPSDDRE
jgi:hypothetical protein